jgi:hypothetical protein
LTRELEAADRSPPKNNTYNKNELQLCTKYFDKLLQNNAFYRFEILRSAQLFFDGCYAPVGKTTGIDVLKIV